ncbi:MAG: efflux RND transporter periplasmic adaptor subunit [Thermoanaerobaculia bacterium]
MMQSSRGALWPALLVVSTLLFGAFPLRGESVEVDVRLTIPPGSEETMNSPASLPVETIATPILQPVAKGTVLLQLDREKLQKELEGARKDLASAQAEKRRLRQERGGATSMPQSQDPAALRAAQEIGMAEAAEQRAMSDLSKLQTELAESTVRAPVDGFVVKQLFAVGAKTKRRKPLLLFADAAKTVIDASVPAAAAAAYSVGSKVRLAATTAEPHSITGKVVSATPAGDTVTLRIQPLELPFFGPDTTTRVALSPIP